MPHVVTESCIQCKYTDCVEICPVDCFHEGPNFLAIDPEECIDCALCVSECPVNAIKSEGDLRKDELFYLQLNEELSLKWPVIKIRKKPLDNHEEFKYVKNKINLLQK